MSHIAALSLDIDQVKAEFQAWRVGRVGRERIPEELWAMALELLKHYPIGIVQRELCLNLNQLKQRAGQLDKHPLSKPQFLEIKAADIAEISGLPHAANNRAQIGSLSTVTEQVCRIVFERSDGSRLTISLPASANIIPAICANLVKQ